MTLIDNQVDSFFNDDVAVNAIYSPAVGEPATVRVIFDRNFYQAPQFIGSDFETKVIVITCKTKDFGNSQQGETVVIDGVTYYIKNPRYSVGVMEIFLSKDPVE